MSDCVAPWKPPQGTVGELVAAGRSWDAVRAPCSIGATVVDQLGENCGAVIQDGYAQKLYWLIKPRTADTWQHQAGSSVTVLGTASYVFVPSVERTEGPGLWWKVPLEPLRYLTDADLLKAVLEEELDAVLGPRTLLACEPCMHARLFETSHDGCTGVSSTELQGRRMRPSAPRPCPCDHQLIRSSDA
ncbi:hypothetical protein OG709_15485 [Streptomyces sp. NBC_01267]|uniref:hypothetical protein n=1 Tax=unclassified Streptomyces TaxID=2593676 RepID=UPI002024B4F0|nr:MULTISPECIES: hypothetical protein [unclassified Streptomyces]